MGFNLYPTNMENIMSS